MQGFETIKHLYEMDFKDDIETYLTRQEILSGSRDMSEMGFSITNRSAVLSSKEIQFDVDFRGRCFSVTIDFTNDFFSPYGNDVPFGSQHLTDVDVSFFEKSMGKVIFKAETTSSFSR